MMFRSHIAEEAECKLQEQQHQSFEVSVPYKLYYHGKAVVCEGTAVLYPASFTIECGHARMKFMHPCQECVLETPNLGNFRSFAPSLNNNNIADRAFHCSLETSFLRLRAATLYP
jgi:hypothetical protein